MRRYSLIAVAVICLGGLTPGFASSLGVSSQHLTVWQGPVSIPCVQQVSMSNNQFTPASATIAPGCTVTWTNTVSTQHTSTNNAVPWDSGNLGRNQTFTRVFGTTGTFPYFCKNHASMTGTITVA